MKTLLQTALVSMSVAGIGCHAGMVAICNKSISQGVEII